MICKKCRKRKHHKCRGGTWCDCQHMEGMVNRNYQHDNRSGNNPTNLDDGTSGTESQTSDKTES